MKLFYEAEYQEYEIKDIKYSKENYDYYATTKITLLTFYNLENIEKEITFHGYLSIDRIICELDKIDLKEMFEIGEE